MKVLLTDDSSFMRTILKSALGKFPDLEFLEAENGDVAVELFQEQRPAITFLDIIMPVKNGIVALKDIRDIDPNAKIVIVTSVGQEEMVNKAKELGVSDFIAKPFKPEQIQEVFTKLTS